MLTDHRIKHRPGCETGRGGGEAGGGEERRGENLNFVSLSKDVLLLNKM